MTKIEVELHEDVVSVLHKLKNVTDTGIELVVPKDAVLFDNILNLRLLQKWSEREARVINFQTDDLNGQNLLRSLEETGAAEGADEELEEDISTIEKEVPPQKLSMPKIKLALPIIRLKKGTILLVVCLLLSFLGLVGFFAYRYAYRLPKANIKIIVNSLPLTRSVEIRVKNGAETSAENKILKGAAVETSLTDEVTIETTGEKLVGEKAEGRVTIFNKTDEERKFKDGTVLIYEDDEDNEYEFITKDDVTIPAREEQAPNPENPEELVYKKGSAAVEVAAAEIGKKYNLDEGEDLSIDGEKRAEFEAEVSEDLEGGKEETIMIVAQEDIDNAIKNLLEKSSENALRALGEKISGGQKLISGSENVSVIKEAFSHKLSDETEELKLTQTFSAKGLVYNPNDMDKLVDSLMGEFLPENYIFSTKERVVNVEVLGNTETTVLSDTEADLQVTLKTFMVTDLSEEGIKDALVGKSIPEAEKYLGSIANVKTFELYMDPRVFFFDFIPKDESRIIIVLERE